MSDSTQDPTTAGKPGKKVPNLKPDKAPSHPPAPGFKFSVWWGASIIFHAGLLVWLLFFSPVKIIDLSKKATDTLDPATVRKVAEQVRERQKKLLVEKVHHLQDIKKELEKLEDRKRDQFREFKRDLTNSVPLPPPATPEPIAQTNDATGQAQTKAVDTWVDQIAQMQEAAVRAQTNALAVQTNVDNALADQIAQMQEAAAQAQTNALAGPTNADIASGVATTPAAKLEIQRAFYGAVGFGTADVKAYLKGIIESGQTSIIVDNDLVGFDPAPEQDKLLHIEYTLDGKPGTLTMGEGKTFTYSANASPPFRMSLPVRSPLNPVVAGEADIAFNAVANPQAQVRAAQNQARGAQNQALDALAASGTNFDSVYHAQNQANTLQEQAAETQQQANALQQQQQDTRNRPNPSQRQAIASQVASLQTQARQVQAQALQAQIRAIEILAAVNAGSVNAVPSDQADPTNLDSMKAEQLYQHAEKTEAAMAESYRRLRATQLAMLTQIPLSRAMDLTEVAKAEHPALHNELQNMETNDADFSALGEAENAVNAEVDAMNNLGESMLAQAQALNDSGSQSAGGAGVALDNIQAETAHELAMGNAADGNQRAVDVSAMMQSGGGDGHGRHRGSDHSSDFANPFGDRIDPSRSGGLTPPSIPPNPYISPGRTVAQAGVSKKFIFVDSWYIIGPFDNIDRANIDTRFPPETVIDLNATYPGKHGYPVRWEFYQAAQPMVTPPFDHYNLFDNLPFLQRRDARYRDLEQIVYYAYTELKFENDCDLWMAIGSDDTSKIWINDQKVWVSGKGLSPWSVDQGFRKVHFNQGVNRILYRVENGASITAFSLVICLPP